MSRILCFFGLHRWTPWFRSADSYIDPESRRRYCDRKGCKAYQRELPDLDVTLSPDEDGGGA